MAERSWTTLPTGPVSSPLICISLYSVESTWLTSDLQQILTLRKFSSPCYKHLTPISSTLEDKPWCYGGTNVEMSVVTVWRSRAANIIQTPCICQSQNKGLRTLPYYVKFLCIFLPVMLYNTYMIAQCNYWMNHLMIFKQAW